MVAAAAHCIQNLLVVGSCRDFQMVLRCVHKTRQAVRGTGARSPKAGVFGESITGKTTRYSLSTIYDQTSHILAVPS